MASRMKGFFPEKKKLGVSKPKKSSAKTKAAAAAPPPVSLDLQGDKEEEVLRQFDMNTAYGPCIGMARLERWNRANAFGLHPPKEVFELIAGKDSRCLWDTRV